MNVQTQVHTINSIARVTIHTATELGATSAIYENDRTGARIVETSCEGLYTTLLRLVWRHLNEMPMSHNDFIERLARKYA